MNAQGLRVAANEHVGREINKNFCAWGAGNGGTHCIHLYQKKKKKKSSSNHFLILKHNFIGGTPR